MADLQQHFTELAAPGVRKLKPYQPGKPLSELERELGIRNAVKLASNENPLGPGPGAIAAARAALADLARYPDGGGHGLSVALAERHSVTPAAITLGNGSNDVLELVARAFLTSRHEAIFSEHAFAVYPIVTQAVGAKARIARASDGTSGMAYGHDLAAMADLVGPDTRVVFIANPNNPTGTWLKKAELEGFVSALPDHVMVVVDEAYYEYVEQPEYPNTADWVSLYPNLIVTRTFSKAYGLAALRVGYSISHPAVADLLNRVRQPFNVNSVAQAAALGALGDTDHLENCIMTNTSGMRELTAAFEGMSLTWIPSVGNFVCLDTGRPADDLYQSLLRRGVIVRPVANYGLPNHLRITIGLPEENECLVTALRDVLT